MPHALIVDDHAETLSSLVSLAAGEGYSTAGARSRVAAGDELRRRPPSVMLVSLDLPDGDGLRLVDDLPTASRPHVVLITGHATVGSAVDALRRRCVDYLTKPLDVGRLRRILARISRTPGTSPDQAPGSADTPGYGALVGGSAAMRAIYEQIARVGPTSATVLLAGPSGTGKELVARTLHDVGPRRQRPFVAINCGAMSPALVESELFGHERGSFTGADRRHRGVFEQAAGGSLFLDEVTEMPVELQVRLLRVLETGGFTRTGGEEEIRVDVRVIAATNREPDDAVRAGRLREDLYYRLKVFELRLPRLRDRLDDVEPLAEQFLREIAGQEGTTKRLSPDAAAMLRRYSWPGNVRELKNAVYSAYVMAAGDLTPECFPPDVRPCGLHASPRDEHVPVQVGVSLAEVERRLIVATLAFFEGSRTRTARTLGISLRTLHSRLLAYRGSD